MADYVTEIMESAKRGSVSGASMYDEDEVAGDDFDQEVAGLVEVGALTEVGAKRLKRAKKAAAGPGVGRLPSPAFAMSQRSTERRAPLGFTEDTSGAAFFTLPGVIGATTTMRGKVSRVAHVDRLLIVPSAPGAIIESIKVGDEEQTLQAGVPVELYGTTSLTDTVPDNFSPIGPALDFIVVLKNTTAVAITGTIGTKASCKR